MHALALLLLLAADCACDPANAESMKARQCSLCAEAEKQPGYVAVFFLKDISPRKPNRWLALPRKHGAGAHHLHEMSAAERTALWTAAIAKAKELFGETEWGLAYNGADVRTQCHTHIHMGRFIPAAEREEGVLIVSSPAEIPAPVNQGVWVHPVDGKLHVHVGEQITETVLVR
jgi:CDP-diacylglycerol pyrophosphatase